MACKQIPNKINRPITTSILLHLTLQNELEVEADSKPHLKNAFKCSITLGQFQIFKNSLNIALRGTAPPTSKLAYLVLYLKIINIFLEDASYSKLSTELKYSITI